MKVVLATKNNGKVFEFSRMLSPLGIEVLKQDDVVGEITVEETGSTFEENAYLKAKAIFDQCGMITLADDSGIEVDALKGDPGVRTARYAGENATDDENIDKLLRNLTLIKTESRTAHFVCAIACVIDKDNCIFVRGECPGFIGYERRGSRGFGYDPIFMVENESFAEMTDSKKDEISHRGIAIRKMTHELELYKQEKGL